MAGEAGGKSNKKLLEEALQRTRQAEERCRQEMSGGEPAAERSAPPNESGEEIAAWEDGIHRMAKENGGLMPTRLTGLFDPEKRLVRLPDAKSALAPSDTETLLNGLIEDCRFLIREVAFHSARLTPDAYERLRFLASAKTLAVTGAKIGKTIAELRGGQRGTAENRYRMIVEHVQAIPPGRLGVGEEKTS